MAAQQESGSAGVQSRSDDGSISFRNWRPVGVEEYGYVAPDPLNPDIIYGGKATRFNFVTGRRAGREPTGIARQIPVRTDDAAAVFARRSPYSVSRLQRAFQNDQWREQLGNHQPRPHAEAVADAGCDSGLRIARPGEGAASRSDLHDCAIAQRRESDLGRHGRRPHSCDAGRRQELARRNACRADAVEQGVADGGFAFRHAKPLMPRSIAFAWTI